MLFFNNPIANSRQRGNRKRKSKSKSSKVQPTNALKRSASASSRESTTCSDITSNTTASLPALNHQRANDSSFAAQHLYNDQELQQPEENQSHMAPKKMNRPCVRFEKATTVVTHIDHHPADGDESSAWYSNAELNEIFNDARCTLRFLCKQDQDHHRQGGMVGMDSHPFRGLERVMPGYGKAAEKSRKAVFEEQARSANINVSAYTINIANVDDSSSNDTSHRTNTSHRSKKSRRKTALPLSSRIASAYMVYTQGSKIQARLLGLSDELAVYTFDKTPPPRVGNDDQGNKTNEEETLEVVTEVATSTPSTDHADKAKKTADPPLASSLSEPFSSSSLETKLSPVSTSRNCDTGSVELSPDAPSEEDGEEEEDIIPPQGDTTEPSSSVQLKEFQQNQTLSLSLDSDTSIGSLVESRELSFESSEQADVPSLAPSSTSDSLPECFSDASTPLNMNQSSSSVLQPSAELGAPIAPPMSIKPRRSSVMPILPEDAPVQMVVEEVLPEESTTPDMICLPCECSHCIQQRQLRERQKLRYRVLVSLMNVLSIQGMNMFFLVCILLDECIRLPPGPVV